MAHRVVRDSYPAIQRLSITRIDKRRRATRRYPARRDAQTLNVQASTVHRLLTLTKKPAMSAMITLEGRTTDAVSRHPKHRRVYGSGGFLCCVHWIAETYLRWRGSGVVQTFIETSRYVALVQSSDCTRNAIS